MQELFSSHDSPRRKLPGYPGDTCGFKPAPLFHSIPKRCLKWSGHRLRFTAAMKISCQAPLVRQFVACCRTTIGPPPLDAAPPRGSVDDRERRLASQPG
ncbi:hypothetical protein A176_002091 [Myxococcus hansupus]|uniref:Uncharacterized protein n=1 Tax=Pseudomyxococcus hansupus TaxID=1297742 RepID=A0A0H4WQZ4_9BACT|nr:hypothetical protein A176_002091 [Myxococcus hansupus]